MSTINPVNFYDPYFTKKFSDHVLSHLDSSTIDQVSSVPLRKEPPIDLSFYLEHDHQEPIDAHNSLKNYNPLQMQVYFNFKPYEYLESIGLENHAMYVEGFNVLKLPWGTYVVSTGHYAVMFEDPTENLEILFKVIKTVIKEEIHSWD